MLHYFAIFDFRHALMIAAALQDDFDIAYYVYR